MAMPAGMLFMPINLRMSYLHTEEDMFVAKRRHHHAHTCQSVATHAT